MSDRGGGELAQVVPCARCATPVFPGEACVRCHPRAPRVIVHAHARGGDVKSVYRWNVLGALLGLVLGVPLLATAGFIPLALLTDARVLSENGGGLAMFLWLVASLPMGPLLGEGLARTVAAARARNKLIAPVHARIDALAPTPIGAATAGPVRVRGRVKLVAAVKSADGREVGAYEAFRAVGNEMQSASDGGVFELVDETGAVVIVHASSARVAGRVTGRANLELRVCEGDEVEVAGTALWTASTREVGRAGLRGSARELHLRGSAEEPVCVRVVQKRAALEREERRSEERPERARTLPEKSQVEAGEKERSGVRVEVALGAPAQGDGEGEARSDEARERGARAR